MPTDIILNEQEKTCKACERPLMKLAEKRQRMKMLDGVLVKAQVKCVECGRISYVVRPINEF